jgi:hypothetical protein
MTAGAGPLASRPLMPVIARRGPRMPGTPERPPSRRYRGAPRAGVAARGCPRIRRYRDRSLMASGRFAGVRAPHGRDRRRGF